jgi:hypothetical protein
VTTTPGTLRVPPSGDFIEGDADGQTLIWNNTLKRWEPGTSGGAVPVLPNWLFVDGDSTAPSPTGSIAAPFTTIQAALDLIDLSGSFSWVVQVTPQAAGPYTEDLVIPGGKAIEFVFGGQAQTTNNGATGNHTWLLAEGETRNRLVFRDAELGSLASIGVPNNPATLEFWNCNIASGLNTPNVNAKLYGNGQGQSVVVVACGDLYADGMWLAGPLTSFTLDIVNCLVQANGEAWTFPEGQSITFEGCDFETLPAFTFPGFVPGAIHFDDLSWTNFQQAGGTAATANAVTHIDSSCWAISAAALGAFTVPETLPGAVSVATKLVPELADTAVNVAAICGLVPMWTIGGAPTAGLTLGGAWLSDPSIGEVTVQFFASTAYAGANESVSLGVLQRTAGA